MNQDFELLVAVDIGTTKVVATAARKYNSGQIEVLGVEQTISSGVKRGVVINIEETAGCIRKVVEALEERLTIRVSEVYVGLSGYNTRSVENPCLRLIKENAEISVIDIEQLRLDSHRFNLDPGEEIVHVIPQEYVVDNELVVGKPIGMYGHRLEANFNIIIGNSNTMRNIKKTVDKAGWNTAGLVFGPLASAYGVLTEDEMEAGVVVVDIGGGTTDLALFQDGILRYTAVIPLGGNLITSDIKEGCSVLQKQAEKLKVEFGSALVEAVRQEVVISIPGMSGWEPKEISMKSLSCIIQARMEEMIEYTLKHIEESGYYDKLGAGIVVTGGGALLKNIVPLFKLKTGLDVKLGLPTQLLTDNTMVENDEVIYATAMGLLTSSTVLVSKKAVKQKQLFEVEEVPQEVREKSKKRPFSSHKRKKSKSGTDVPGDLFTNIKDAFVNMFDDNNDVEFK